MSGTSDHITCPNCGDPKAYRFENGRPPMLDISCYECGFYVTSRQSYMNLEEINEMRIDNDMEPLTELPDQETFY